MLSPTEKLKQKLKGSQDKVTLSTEYYLLAKELGCLGELLGREYSGSFKLWKWKIPFHFKQKPIPIPAFTSMMEEMQKDYKRQNKAMKKSSRKGKG